MNILIRTAASGVVSRPDTTYRHNIEEVYLPDFVERVNWSPILFARVCKAGRSIAQKFAERYYDGIGYGVLLYPENLIDGSEEGYARACCLDHTTFLPFPLYNKVTLGQKSNRFELKAGEEKIFSYNKGDAELVCRTLEEVSAVAYIRTGDIVALELQPRKPLCARPEAGLRISGSYCGNPTLDFKIVL